MKIKCLVVTTLLVGLGNLYASDWSYHGEYGPKKWGELNEEYRECKIGKTQAPINIIASLAKQVKNELVLDYKTDAKDLLIYGRSIQVNFQESSKITFKGINYKLVQTHFHTPAENHIDGKVYPLEMHLVHQSNAGKLLVVGVLFQEGENNAELQKIVAVVPKLKKNVNLKNIEVFSILPQSKAYYAFDGSLTTPPCSANVQWIVLKNPVQASKQQIQDLHAILHDNARDIQELNSREIEVAE